MSELSTRIQLKRDTSANWNAVAESFKLLPGELAFETDTGYVKIGIYGEGETSAQGALWKDTPYVNINDVSSVHGLEAALAATEATAIDKTENKVIISTDVDIADVEDGKNTGDIAIVKKLIADGKYEYTAYVWNADTESEISGWQAMDGNYSAENVFFPDNMTMTYAFGKYTVPSSGSYELSCKGKSVQSMINDAFAETKPGTVTQPSFSLTTTASLTGEVGTTYDIPAATFKMTSIGSYQYGPATGISVAVGACTITCDASTGIADKTNTTALTANNSGFSTAAGTIGVTYTDSKVTYNYGATYSYGDGTVPKNNIGGDDPDRQIKGKTGQTETCKCEATGKRKHFWGYRLIGDEYDINTLTSGNIRGLQNNGYSLPSTTASAKATNFTVPAHTKQIILASPHVASPKKIAAFNNSSLGAALDFDNGNAAKQNAVQVEGANSYTAIGYDIWYVTFGAELAVETNLAITWA